MKEISSIKDQRKKKMITKMIDKDGKDAVDRNAIADGFYTASAQHQKQVT